MKKLILVLVLFFGMTTLVSAQSKPGEFKFDAETHDFGKVVIGKAVVHTFTFTNVGESPIIISKIETTCGCTVPEYTKTPVNPGEKGTIKVTLTPSGPALPIAKSITITSNARTTSKTLIIKAFFIEG